MKTDAETNLAGVKKAAEDASGGVNTTTATNWGNSASEVKKNLDKMKQTANLKLGEMQKTVESHFSGQYNTMTKKWEKACERIGQLITQMVRSTKDLVLLEKKRMPGNGSILMRSIGWKDLFMKRILLLIR